MFLKNTLIQSRGHAIEICGGETGHSVHAIGFMEKPEYADWFVKQAKACPILAMTCADLCDLVSEIVQHLPLSAQEGTAKRVHKALEAIEKAR